MSLLRLAVLAHVLLPRLAEGLAHTLLTVDPSPEERHEFAAGHRSVQSSPEYIPGELLGNIADSTIIANNLGGMGPVTSDPEVIILKDFGIVEGVPITVKISNSTDYMPADADAAKQNGRGLSGDGLSGFLNMKCGTETQLRYSFYKFVNGTEVPVTIETVYFTFLDIDSGNKKIVKEYYGVSTPFEEYYLSVPTELADYTVPGWNGTAWISTEPGNGWNNPSDPMNMTLGQKSRSVTLKFNNVSYVDTLFGLTPKNGCHGRNFMFAMLSNMVPTPAPTPSPTPLRTFQPTPSPTPAPTGNNSEVCGTCVIWGDPHIITFKAHQRRIAQHPRREEFFRTRGWKSDQININEAGKFWLIKSDSVRIQGRFEKNETSGQTSLASLIVGGPFLQGRVLQIRPMNSRTTWEGEEILPSIPSVFKNELVYATYHNGAKMVKDGTVGPGMDVALPLGVTLTVNRWRDLLAAEISMCQTEAQSGLCGSQANDFY